MSDMLKSLEEKAADLEGQLKKVENEIREEKLRIIAESFGVKIGSVVINGKGIRHKVSDIYTGFRGKPWIYGCPEKKDKKTFSRVVSNLYTDWEIEK